ncbi:hypothetical protein PanWU01x14_304150, partial [Parasponia andersonii]
FLDTEPKSEDSWTWKGICQTQSLINKEACKHIGNERSINLWMDPWVPNYPNFKTPTIGEPRMGFIFVSDLCYLNGGWNLTKITQVFTNNISELIIQLTPPSPLRFDS